MPGQLTWMPGASCGPTLLPRASSSQLIHPNERGSQADTAAHLADMKQECTETHGWCRTGQTESRTPRAPGGARTAVVSSALQEAWHRARAGSVAVNCIPRRHLHAGMCSSHKHLAMPWGQRSPKVHSRSPRETSFSIWARCLSFIKSPRPGVPGFLCSLLPPIPAVTGKQGTLN